MWSLFGVVWTAGVRLADIMATEPVDGLRILEVGCGLALASMVVHARGGNVVASDLHPLAGKFLAENLAANDLPPLRFEVLDWRLEYPALGHFDLIIGSDLLYERDQPESLANFVDRHCDPVRGRAIVTDPGRRQMARFTRLMRDRGFEVDAGVSAQARVARYSRASASHQGASSTTVPSSIA